jgi:hypothetical protein
VGEITTGAWCLWGFDVSFCSVFGFVVVVLHVCFVSDVFVACAVVSGADFIRRKRDESRLSILKEIKESMDRAGEKMKLLEAEFVHLREEVKKK